MTRTRSIESYSIQRETLVKRLTEEGIVRSSEVARALRSVKREEFVWPDTKRYAYSDTPLPLGDTGQTISAPHMAALMLEELELRLGHGVLEIGAGSGYNAALMAELVNPKGFPDGGSVITVERQGELVNFARENLERNRYSQIVRVIHGDGTLGYPERSREELHDRIVVTAAAPHVPKYLEFQLRKGGVILIPVGDLWAQSLVKVRKDSSGKLSSKNVCGCMFVPLVGADGHSSVYGRLESA